MAEREPDPHGDPLRFLDQAFSGAAEAVWLPERRLCLSDADAARAVLTNEAGLYEEHSDFFNTRRGTFGPRSLQVEMGRSAVALLSAHLRARADELPDVMRRALVPTSEWPDAGNWLVYRHLKAALVTPDSPARLLRVLDEVVERAVLAGARERHSALRRAVFRWHVNRELVRAVRERHARAPGPHADILDAVVRSAGPEVPADELAEVFLSFLFATAGSVGFVLGWALYLLGTQPPTHAEPAWVVREALRLYPVAWILERRPTRPHDVAGTPVSPTDRVIACPYAVHRNPRHWEDPERFRPERWAETSNPRAFIPFGWGPHRCVAGNLSIQFVAELLRLIGQGYRMTVTPRAARPHMDAALAPPKFTLNLVPNASHIREEGGE